MVSSFRSRALALSALRLGKVPKSLLGSTATPRFNTVETPVRGCSHATGAEGVPVSGMSLLVQDREMVSFSTPELDPEDEGLKEAMTIGSLEPMRRTT